MKTLVETKSIRWNLFTVLSVLIPFVVSYNILGFVTPRPTVYYGLCILTVCAFIPLLWKGTKINGWVFSFILVSFISIALNIIDKNFHSWERLSLFIIIIIIVSPLLHNTRLNAIRCNMFMGLIYTCLLISVVSFVTYLFGVEFWYGAGSGGYGGITNNPMHLGACSATSALYLISHLPKNKKYKYFWIIAFMIMTFNIIIAGARGIFAGYLFGLLVFMFKYLGSSVKKLLQRLIIIGIIAIAAFPLYGGAFKHMQEKLQNERLNEQTSRDMLWQARIDEFLSSPLIGIGFAAVNIMDNNIKEGFESSGKIETGSSWLALLSMTGLIGCTAILGLVLQVIMRIWKIQTFDAFFILALQAFLCVFMISEGFVVGAGSFLFLEFWLLQGHAIAYSSNNSYKI